MIKFENTEVFNFEGAIRGMRNPLNSWDKSDSKFDRDPDNGCSGSCPCERIDNNCECCYIGSNDLDLAQRLIKAGSDHRKFLRQIFVTVDITAPLYWWKEFDTYKVGTVANSCSTMHKIHAKEFIIEDFSTEHLGDSVIVNNQNLNIAIDCLQQTINVLNTARSWYESTKDKSYWWLMIQLLPSSYNQKRTVTLNYEVIRNIYGSRKGHKLDEWTIGFMEWIDTLPYAEELIKS